ncbi:MAG: gluconate 2-dehydrogenase subunit 3 family protein [Myxococcales bacterium]|nr:gluconate 2-dehydrogenase subunit 3 family protein [Myxococcales bacterium]
MGPPSQRSPLSRRRILQVSGAAGLALAGGSALLLFGSDEHYRALLPKGVRPTVLSEKELAVLFAAVDRLVPDSEGWPKAREARIAERIDRELSFHTAKMHSDFKAVLFLLEHGGVFRLSFTRFTKLSAEEQHARLAKMAEGAGLERQCFAALKAMTLFFYYCDERCWPKVGYQGPFVSVRAPPEADSNPLRQEA